MTERPDLKQALGRLLGPGGPEVGCDECFDAARPLRRARARRRATPTRRSPGCARTSTAALPAARSTRACARSSAASKRCSRLRGKTRRTRDRNGYGANLLWASTADGARPRDEPAGRERTARRCLARAHRRGARAGRRRRDGLGCARDRDRLGGTTCTALGDRHERRRRRRRAGERGSSRSRPSHHCQPRRPTPAGSRRGRPHRREPALPAGRRHRGSRTSPPSRATPCSQRATASSRTGGCSAFAKHG